MKAAAGRSLNGLDRLAGERKLLEAFSTTVTVDGYVAQRHDDGLPRLLNEAFGARARIYHAPCSGDFVGVLRNDGAGLDQFVHRKCSLVRPHCEDIADVHHGEVHVVELTDQSHVAEKARSAGPENGKAVREANDVARFRARITREPKGKVAFNERGGNSVAVRDRERRYPNTGCDATELELAAGAGTQDIGAWGRSIHLGEICGSAPAATADGGAQSGGGPVAKPEGRLAAHSNLYSVKKVANRRLLATTMSTPGNCSLLNRVKMPRN